MQFFSKAWKITTHHKLSSCLNTLHQKWLLALSLRNCQQVAYKVFKFVVSILGLARVKFSSFFSLFPLICNVIFSSRKCSFSRVHKTYLQIWLNGIWIAPIILICKRPVTRYSQNGTYRNSCKYSFVFHIVLKALEFWCISLGNKFLLLSFKLSIFYTR